MNETKKRSQREGRKRRKKEQTIKERRCKSKEGYKERGKNKERRHAKGKKNENKKDVIKKWVGWTKKQKEGRKERNMETKTGVNNK